MRISSLLVICSTKELGMVISNSDPTSFSKWPFLLARSWIPELIYNTTLQRSREFSIRSRKICLVPLNCTTKMGQIIFIWQKQQNTRHCGHYRAHKKHSYLRRIPPFYYEKPSIFMRKAPASSPAHYTGQKPRLLRQARTVFVNISHYASLQSFYHVADF